MNEWTPENIRAAIDQAAQHPLPKIDFFDQFCRANHIIHFKEAFFHFLAAKEVDPYIEWNELEKQWQLFLDETLKANGIEVGA